MNKLITKSFRLKQLNYNQEVKYLLPFRRMPDQVGQRMDS